MGRKVSILLALGAGASILASGMALAADPAAPATANSAADTSKRVCRSVMPTGSRFSQRVCKTKAQWEEEAQKAQRMLEDSNNNLRSPAADAAHGL